MARISDLTVNGDTHLLGNTYGNLSGTVTGKLNGRATNADLADTINIDSTIGNRNFDVLFTMIDNKLYRQPEGAFYLYADCSAIAPDSQAFARNLLEEAGVAITPGIDFGTRAPETHIRIAYASDIDRLDAAVKRIRDYLTRQ